MRDGILVIETENLGIARRGATSRAFLKAQLHPHLLPRVLGTQLGAVHGKMRLTSRWGVRRCHRLLGSGTRLGARIIGKSHADRVAAGTEEGTRSAFPDSMDGS